MLLWILPGRLCVLTFFSVLEEKFSAEVESWMTGEQYASWLLSARYCQKMGEGLGGMKEAVTSSKVQTGQGCRLEDQMWNSHSLPTPACVLSLPTPVLVHFHLCA